ncbi:hypothetical protein EYF80_034923 [Liparis tanakae]|uniref:Uncharacterized protein n=1 Tax=Liparis tanakae TaxID=230148 RepID=A0A4Z2GQ45_9TELE|nr:hypothetical protein EYF80_034923 [Liparis tanakae]
MLLNFLHPSFLVHKEDFRVLARPEGFIVSRGTTMALAGCPDYFLHHSNYQRTTPGLVWYNMATTDKLPLVNSCKTSPLFLRSDPLQYNLPST